MIDQINLDHLEVSEIRSRIVAIVRFGPSGFNTDGFRAGEYFQVTIDPKRISPSGEFIRFGTYDGDEIMGWQRCKAMSVVEILAEWPEEQPHPLLEYGSAFGVTMLASAQPAVVHSES